MRRLLLATAATVVLASPAFADIDAAKKWIDSDFQPSALSKEERSDSTSRRIDSFPPQALLRKAARSSGVRWMASSTISFIRFQLLLVIYIVDWW